MGHAGLTMRETLLISARPGSFPAYRFNDLRLVGVGAWAI